MNKKSCCDGYLGLEIGQRSKFEVVKHKKVLRKKCRLEKTLYSGLFPFNPVEKGEPLKVGDHGIDVMKLVFVDNLKGERIGSWSLPALKTLWNRNTVMTTFP